MEGYIRLKSWLGLAALLVSSIIYRVNCFPKNTFILHILILQPHSFILPFRPLFNNCELQRGDLCVGKNPTCGILERNLFSISNA